MIKTFITTFIVVILVCSSTAFSQDFAKLLEAVDKIEANLKAMIKQEASNRTDALNALKEELKTTGNTTQTDATLVAQVESLQNSLKSIRQEIQLYQKGMPDTFASEQELSAMLADIEYLKAENAFMRSLADKNAKLLVSLEGSGTSEVITGNQVQALENKLEVLNHQISSLQESQSEGGESASFGGIEMSGFMDFVSSYSNSPADKSDIALGQAEVDLAKNLTESHSVEVAIAYNADDSKFELGAAILDMTFSDNFSLTVGQFDVPFGIDYHTYASVDRKLISAPSVVEHTHEGWNDIGANLTINHAVGNISLFVVNGFEASAEVIDEIASLSTGVDVFEEVDTSPANAFGGRFGFNITSNLEIGSSVALGMNADGKDEMLLIGGDLNFHISHFSIEGEYINHSVNRSVNNENNQGYYLQTEYDFNSFYVVSRYGSFQPADAEWIGQFSIGGGIPLSNGTELRVESLMHESNVNNTTMFQLVAEF